MIIDTVSGDISTPVDFVTMIEADVPRVDCEKYGVHQVRVPSAEPGGRFTALFEALTISWLKVATVKAVSEQIKITRGEVSGIMERTVKRGLSRRESRPIEDLAIDETSFQKRPEYVTVVTDRNSGTIIEILDDRKKATLQEWLDRNQSQLQAVRSVSMDMWEPFINAVSETIEGADEKICFNRLHIAAYFGKALEKIRATEHRDLRKQGISPLTRTRHDWLRTQARNEYRDKRSFLSLTRLNLKTARA